MESISAKELGRKGTARYVLRECLVCGDKKWIFLTNARKSNFKGLCINCHVSNYLGEGNPAWNGGRHLSYGYVFIMKKGHPFANKDGYVMEHRFIAAEKWGIEAVRGMVVHHIDGNRANNSIENLKLMTLSKHAKHHNAIRPRSITTGRFI